MEQPLQTEPLLSSEWPDDTLHVLPLWDSLEELTNAHREMARLERIARGEWNLKTLELLRAALNEQRERCQFWERSVEELRPRYETELWQRIEARMLLSKVQRED